MRGVDLSSSSILIVDDLQANVHLLEQILGMQGYWKVTSTTDSRQVATICKKLNPDLVLLDLHMPHFTGLEVIEQLRCLFCEDSYLPILVLTADITPDAKRHALQIGANDFLSKPFDVTEALLRVRNLLETRHLHQQIQNHNRRLEETVRERTRDLAEANERLTILDRSKNEFLTLISHEFRTPLNGLLGVGELILAEMPSTKENHELPELFERSRRRILAILDDALLLTQIDVSGEQFRPGLISLSKVLSRAVEGTTEFAESHRVILSRPSADLKFVLGDEALLVRALRALLETAVKFSEKGETVRLSRDVVPDSPTIIIESHGRTIPSPALAKFFDVFSIGEALTPGGDLGLGPSLAYRILSLFGASVSVANRDSSGIRLTISFEGSETVNSAR